MPAVDLSAIRLEKGAHSSREEGVCATEAIAWLAGEPHTDQPQCLSPVLGGFLRSWNDATDDAGREALKPFLPRAIGTAGDGHDELRGWLAADWLVRECAPAWLAHSAAEARREAAKANLAKNDLQVGVRLVAVTQRAWDGGKGTVKVETVERFVDA